MFIGLVPLLKCCCWDVHPMATWWPRLKPQRNALAEENNYIPLGISMLGELLLCWTLMLDDVEVFRCIHSTNVVFWSHNQLRSAKKHWFSPRLLLGDIRESLTQQLLDNWLCHGAAAPLFSSIDLPCGTGSDTCGRVRKLLRSGHLLVSKTAPR